MPTENKPENLEPEGPMSDEQFLNIYNYLLGRGVSSEKIAAFVKKYDEGIKFVKTKKTAKQEVAEFYEDLIKNIPDMSDEELKWYSKKYFGYDPDTAGPDVVIDPSNKFLHELDGREIKKRINRINKNL